MKNIAVLIDFTEGSKNALHQAALTAQKANGKLFGIHIVSAKNKVAEGTQTLQEFMQTNCNMPFEVVVADGNLITATQSALKTAAADLVFICTHGVKGAFQFLFGAQILKLVQGITTPALVIQESNKTDMTQTRKILFPVGPYPDFHIKIEQTAALAKLLGATVVIYEIDRPGSDFENLLNKHAMAAKTHFEAKGVEFERVIEEQEVISIGYSRQTTEYAIKNGITMISLMATVSKNDLLFGFGDKENFLVNNHGISILTCNA